MSAIQTNTKSMSGSRRSCARWIGACLVLGGALCAAMLTSVVSKASNIADQEAFRARLKSSAAEICGAPAAPFFSSRSRIDAYSREAAHPSAPWMAKLEIIESIDDGGVASIANCGATALTRNWLITAAHCVGSSPWIAVEATLGAQNLEDPRALRRMASLALCPTQFQGLGAGPDVALIRLLRPLPPDFPTLRVASYGEMRRLTIGRHALAAGWPRQGDDVAAQLSAPILELTPPGTEPPGVLVAQPLKAGASPCVGESGAPLVAELGHGPALIGVFSSVDAIYDPQSGVIQEICAGDQARSYFTSLGGMQDWISAAIRACDQDLTACVGAP